MPPWSWDTTSRPCRPTSPPQTSAESRRGRPPTSEALGSSLQLRLLDLLTEAGLESRGSPDGHVEVRLAGRDPQLVYVAEEAVEPHPRAKSWAPGSRCVCPSP